MAKSELFVVLAEGNFGPLTSKTANSVIRYLPERTVGGLDRCLAGKTAQDVRGFGGGCFGCRAVFLTRTT